MTFLFYLTFLSIYCISCSATNVEMRPYLDTSCKSLLENALKAIHADKEPIVPDKLRCPVESKAVSWIWFRNNTGNFKEIVDFLQENADWPEQRKIRAQAELSINAGTPKKEVIDYFQKFPPTTSEGALAYARAASILPTAERLSLIKKIWHETYFTKADEKAFHRAYRKLLTKEDHAQRLDRLIYDRNYYGLDRMKPLVSSKAQDAINFIMNILRKKRTSKAKFDALIPYYKNNPAVLVCLIKGLMQQKKEEEALNFFQRALQSRVFEQYPTTLRKYRNYFARSLFQKGQALQAYQLLNKHPLPEEKNDLISYVEGEWFAAWLALRDLHQPQRAFQKFKKLYHIVKTPISLSKMAYWAGRARETLEDEAGALEWFEKSTKFPYTYYGQLSLRKLGRPFELQFDTPGSITLETTTEKELFTLLQTLCAHNFEQEAETIFLFLAKTLNPENVKALLHAAKDLHMEHMVVLSAKFAGKNGAILIKEVYPIRDLPKNLTTLPHLSQTFIHALIRQESGFNTKITSGASAKGLMQLMGRTAKQVARKHKIPFKESYLTEYPDINLKLGCHHLSELLEKYDGNIVLTLAAYNAGATPVAKWIKTFGDPREPSTDIVDWVESIPFEETRSYVQRILETLPVYNLLF